MKDRQTIQALTHAILEACHPLYGRLLFTPMNSRTMILLYCVLATTILLGQELHAEKDRTTAAGLVDSSYASMVKADLSRDGGDLNAALDGYRYALSGFVSVSQQYPELDPEVVRFRISYCDNQIESLMKAAGFRSDEPEETPESRDGQAPSHMQTATANADAVSMQLREVRRLISARDLTGARKELITLLKQTPDDPEVRVLMSIIQCMLGRFDDAENMMTTLIEEEPALARAHSVLSTAQIGLGKTEKAKASLEKAIELGTNSPEVYYNMTQIILNTKPLDAEAARESYRKSLELGGRKDTDLDYLLK